LFILGILSIQCKIRHYQPTETRQSTGKSQHQPVNRINLLSTPALGDKLICWHMLWVVPQ